MLHPTKAFGDPSNSTETAIHYVGVLQSSREAIVHSLVEGMVLTVQTDAGSDAAEQAFVLQIDDRLQAARVREAEVAAAAEGPIRELAAMFERSKVQFSRIREALQGEAAASWELDQAKSEAEALAGRLTAAKEAQALARAKLASEQELLTRYRVLAPLNGPILEVFVTEGATVRRGDPLFRQAVTDQLEAVVYLPDQWFGRITAGQAIPLRIQSGADASVRAHVAAVIPEIDPGSRTFRCLLIVPNLERRFAAGMTVTIDEAALHAASQSTAGANVSE